MLLKTLALWTALAAAVCAMRDYAANNYFLVELNTTNLNGPLQDFISQHAEYKFEHQLKGMDNFYVFSIDKMHPHNEFLGNHRSNRGDLLKRNEGFEEEYEKLVNNPNLRSIHMLPEKRLKKRMPVMIERNEWEDQRQIMENRAKVDGSVRRLEIVDSSQEPAKKVSDALDIQDPLFLQQWHLVNTFYPGHDLNISGLWQEGYTGNGSVTAVIDDGLDYENPDLTDNFNKKGSWDFNDDGNLPLPRLFDDYHGTRCAGEIAAVKNEVCGVGVAYDSQVAGVRILSGSITSADEAAAMVYGLDVNDVYSCSWGPTDDGRTLAEPDLVVKKAMLQGVQKGRKDKGAVYVFASGNGGRYQDSCNFDGYTNSIYSITVGAIDYRGLHPTYAEACAAVMVVTYSSGSGEHIHTTDIHNKCSATHGGTSAAAPIAAGVYAIVLSANPNLTWRDVQYVLVLLSVTVNEDDGSYQKTANGKLYSHKYGYGKIDAHKMVHYAKEWKNVKPQAWYFSDIQTANEKIESGKDVARKVLILRTMTVTKDDMDVMNLERIEHVTVKVNVRATFRGRVAMRLISPTGVVSDLATFRPRDLSLKGFTDWTFMSVAHWGENGIGDWKLECFGDNDAQETNTIELDNWQLRFFGESHVAEDAEEFDIEKDYAAVRRDKLKQKQESGSTLVVPSSTSVPTSTEVSSEAQSSAEPSPTSSSESQTTSQATSESISETTSSSSIPLIPSPTDKVSDPSTTLDVSHPDTGLEEEESEVGKNKHYTTDHTGQYLIGLAIVGFVVVLLIMKFHKSPGSSRRRRRRDEYEFDIIPGEDYSDSDEDSLDLGHRRRPGDREVLFGDEEVMPGYLEGAEEMFSIGGDEDEDTGKKSKQDTTKESKAKTDNEESLAKTNNEESLKTEDKPQEEAESGSSEQDGLLGGSK